MLKDMCVFDTLSQTKTLKLLTKLEGSKVEGGRRFRY